MVAVPTVWIVTLMSWLALALYSPSLLPTLVCWIVVPALIAVGITPTLRTFRAYWDG
jgi:hypothetical protein